MSSRECNDVITKIKLLSFALKYVLFHTYLDFALVEDEYPVVVEDGVEAVRDGEEGPPLQLAEQRLLHQRVGLLVHRGRRLVQQDQL